MAKPKPETIKYVELEVPLVNLENLEFYRGELEKLPAEVRGKDILSNVCRFEVGDFSFGGRFIHQVLEGVFRFGIMTKEAWNDFSWQPTVDDFITLIGKLIEAMIGKQSAAA